MSVYTPGPSQIEMKYTTPHVDLTVGLDVHASAFPVLFMNAQGPVVISFATYEQAQAAASAGNGLQTSELRVVRLYEIRPTPAPTPDPTPAA